MNRFLYSLQIQGGEPFVLQAFGNPEISHSGATSVGAMYLTPQECFEIDDLCLSKGAKVSFFRREDEISGREEQLRLLQKDLVLPCIECPNCSWYDPVTLGDNKVCFLREAPKESVEVLLSQPKKLTEARNCPLTTPAEVETWGRFLVYPPK